MKINQQMSEFQLAQAQKEIVEDVLGVKHVVNTSRNAINNFNKKLGKELHVKTTDNPTLTNLIKDTAKMKKANIHYEPNTSIWYKIDGTTLYIRGHEAEGYSQHYLVQQPSWYDNTNLITVIIQEQIVPISCKGMFYGCSNITNIENLDNIKITHHCVDLTGMFGNCQKLNTLENANLSDWDVCNVTSLRLLFYNCKNLTTIRGLEKWNTHNNKYLYYTFSNSNITDLTSINNWDVSNVVNMQGCFSMCQNLSKLDLSTWNVRNVKTFKSMFYNCRLLTTVGDLSNWNAPKCKNAEFMFAGYAEEIDKMRFVEIKLDNLFKNGVIESVKCMFQQCIDLKSLGDLSKWNVSNVTTFKLMFFNCVSLIYIGDLSKWNAPKCTNASLMFAAGTIDLVMSFTKLDLRNLFKDGIIEDIDYMFQRCKNLEYLDISNWNVQNVSRIIMFDFRNFDDSLDRKLKHIGDLSNWNTQKVTSFEQAFFLFKNLTQIGSLKFWNTSNVTNMTRMFNCTPVNGLDMKNWDTSKCTNMYEAFGNFNAYTEYGEGISYIKSLCPIYKGTNTNFAFWYNRNLTTIEDSGTISESVNFAYSPLTHDSALVLINALDAENPGTLTLSTETYATLTDEDKAIATAKGWTIAA